MGSLYRMPVSSSIQEGIRTGSPIRNLLSKALGFGYSEEGDVGAGRGAVKCIFTGVEVEVPLKDGIWLKKLGAKHFKQKD